MWGGPAHRVFASEQMPVVLGRSPQAAFLRRRHARVVVRMRGWTGTAAASPGSPTSATTAPTCASTTARCQPAPRPPARCTAAAASAWAVRPAIRHRPASASTCCALPTRSRSLSCRCADDAGSVRRRPTASTPLLFVETCRYAGSVEVETARLAAPTALEVVRRWTPDMLVIDLHLPDIIGYELLPALRLHLAMPPLPRFPVHRRRCGRKSPSRRAVPASTVAGPNPST